MQNIANIDQATKVIFFLFFASTIYLIGGGTCEEHDGTFSCYCPPGLAGSYCEHDVSQFALKIASFTGHSWVQIVNPDDMINRFELELSFRSFSENGLLFYAQQDLKMAGSDFISIHLKEGFVEFSFDLGSGPAILKSSQPIKLGHWHHLVAKRYHQDGFLAIDGIDKITGQTVGSIKTLNVDKMAYFGGFGEGTYLLKVFKKLYYKSLLLLTIHMFLLLQFPKFKPFPIQVFQQASLVASKMCK